MTVNAEVWKKSSVAQNYLQKGWKAQPFAAEYLSMMLRVIKSAQPTMQNVLDIGCGDGILGHVVLDEYPTARGVFLDFSEPMLEAAKQRLIDYSNRVSFVMADYSQPNWINSLENAAPFDVIVSGFSIHHQPDENKKAIYADIFNLLAPDGLFLNMEHVSPITRRVESWYNDLMIDARYAFYKANGKQTTREEIAEAYLNREDSGANILAPLDTQCQWLREIGFTDVDAYFKVFEMALFGGIRPE